MGIAVNDHHIHKILPSAFAFLKIVAGKPQQKRNKFQPQTGQSENVHKMFTILPTKKADATRPLARLYEFERSPFRTSAQLYGGRYLEMERSGLSAEIGKLRRQGTIEAERRRFKICRPLDA